MFYLKRKIKRGKLISFDFDDLYGLEVKPRNSKGNINVKSILICDTNIKSRYIKKQLDKKFSHLCNSIYKFLVSDDDSEDGIKACLGEIEKLKSIIFNKYREHMKSKMYKEYLAKIVLTENEFKEKYREREYYSKLIDKAYNNYNNFIEEIEKARSR